MAWDGRFFLHRFSLSLPNEHFTTPQKHWTLQPFPSPMPGVPVTVVSPALPSSWAGLGAPWVNVDELLGSAPAL